MASITDAQIDAAIPPVPDVLPLVAGEPSRAQINVLLRSIRDSAQSYSRTRERFFSSLHRGANFRSRRFTSAIPDYAVGTVYAIGHVVKNAGGMYVASGALQAGASYGTFIAQGPAPTGTGHGVIFENPDAANNNRVGRWLYIGAYSAAMHESAEDCAMTWEAVPGSGYTLYRPDLAQSPYWLTGGNFVASAPYGGGYGMRTDTTVSGTFGSVRYMTDSPVIYHEAHGKKATNSYYWPFVINGYQGRPLGGRQAPVQATAGDPYFAIKMVFPDSRPREIFSEIKNFTFAGISIPPQYSVWVPENPNRYRIMFGGDSFQQGGWSGDGGLSRGQRVCQMLGCDDGWDVGIGNTGYIWAGSGTNYLNPARMAYMIAAQPDIVYMAATDWDVGYTSTQRKVAYRSFIDQLLAGIPDVILILSGSRGSAAVEADMAAVVAEYASPSVMFTPNYPGPGGINILTGDGAVERAGTVQGNTQWMLGGWPGDEHPNMRGNEYLAWRDFEAICAAMRSLP